MDHYFNFKCFNVCTLLFNYYNLIYNQLGLWLPQGKCLSKVLSKKHGMRFTKLNIEINLSPSKTCPVLSSCCAVSKEVDVFIMNNEGSSFWA